MIALEEETNFLAPLFHFSSTANFLARRALPRVTLDV